MDTGKRGAVHVQGFLEVVSPASAAEFNEGKRQVQRHMRQSFSQKRPTKGDKDASADDRVHEAALAIDAGCVRASLYFSFIILYTKMCLLLLAFLPKNTS